VPIILKKKLQLTKNAKIINVNIFILKFCETKLPGERNGTEEERN